MKTTISFTLLAIIALLGPPANADEEHPVITLRMTAMKGDPEFRLPILASARKAVAQIPELKITDDPDADVICNVTAMRFDTTSGTPAGMVFSIIFMSNLGTQLVAAEMLNDKRITPEGAAITIETARYQMTQDAGIKDYSGLYLLAMDEKKLNQDIAEAFGKFRNSMMQQRYPQEKAIVLKAMKKLPQTETSTR